MRIPKQFRRRLSALIRNAFSFHNKHTAVTGESERSSAAPLTNEALQVLLERYVAERTDDSQRITVLERLHRETQAARSSDHDRFTALKQQLRELQAERNQARNQIKALGSSLTETRDRLDAAQRQAAALQNRMEEQARISESSRSHASTLLHKFGRQIAELENKGRIYLQMGQDTKVELQSQRQRMGWTAVVAAMAIVLASLCGAILVWEVQKNAKLLNEMYSDVGQLIVSIDKHFNTMHSVLAQEAAPADVVRQDVTAIDDVGTISGSLDSVGDMLDVTSDDETAGSLSDGPQDAGQGMPDYSQMSLGVKETSPVSEEAATRGLVMPDRELHYEVVRPGTGRSPEITDRVVVNYLGLTPEGKVIDDTYSTGRSATFQMGKLPLYLREALLKMEEGAEWEVFLPEEQRGSGTFTRRGAQETGPVLYLIELVEVLSDTGPPVRPSME